jgi:colanic acid biosynthesis glycosyl transferase WcaI
VVRVLASRQRYDDPHARLPRAESKSGVFIERLATTRFGRSVLLGRGFDSLSFYGSAWRSILAWANPGAVLVVKTDPPLLCVVAMEAAKRRGLHLVNWMQDLYPEVATQLRVPLVKGPAAQALMQLRDVALRSAKANVVVGERMEEIICARGVKSDRIHVIPNWCDDEEIIPELLAGAMSSTLFSPQQSGCAAIRTSYFCSLAAEASLTSSFAVCANVTVTISFALFLTRREAR